MRVKEQIWSGAGYDPEESSLAAGEDRILMDVRAKPQEEQSLHLGYGRKKM